MAYSSTRWFATCSVLAFFCLLSTGEANAQHFSGCLSTTSNATILVPKNVSSAFGSDGASLDSGDEIAVFTNDGACAGVGYWNNAGLVIAVAGTNSQESSGYEPGETFKFKAWDASDQTTYHPEVTYESCDSGNPLCLSNGQYEVDMVYTVSSMSDTAAPGSLEIVDVSASAEQEPNVAPNTVDGDLSTRWSAPGEGVWIQHELSGETALNQIGIAWQYGDKRAADFDIALSPDGSSWTTVYEGTSSGTTLEREYYSFASTPARYVRITGYGNTQNSWTSITEVSAHGSPTVTDPTITDVSASAEQEPNVAPNTVDGDLSTRWSAPGEGVWIQHELSGETALNQIGIAWQYGDKRAADFDIALSPDGSSWTTVYEGTSSGTTLEREYYSFASTPARYVRITGYGNTQNSWTSITEVDILGTGNGLTPETLTKAMTQPIEEEKPEVVSLESNYPNPFHHSTTIRYAIPERAHVTLEVYDMLGRRVARLIDRQQPTGRYDISLTAANWSSGVYVYRLRVAEEVRTGRMVVVR